MSYLLSVLAAVIYLVATVALAPGRPDARCGSRGWRSRSSWSACSSSGPVSYLVPSEFPDKTVWSHFGAGYGYVPLLLPVLGLLWLRSRAASGPGALRAHPLSRRSVARPIVQRVSIHARPHAPTGGTP